MGSSFLTRDQTQATCIGPILATGPPVKSQFPDFDHGIKSLPKLSQISPTSPSFPLYLGASPKHINTGVFSVLCTIDCSLCPCCYFGLQFTHILPSASWIPTTSLEPKSVSILKLPLILPLSMSALMHSELLPNIGFAHSSIIVLTTLW